MLITLARKPLIGSVVQNALTWGCGVLDVDGCRIPTDDKLSGGHAKAGQQMTGGWARPWMDDPVAEAANAVRSRDAAAKAEALGRWPANLIHDGSDEVVGLFPDCKPATSCTRRADRCFAPGTNYQAGSQAPQAVAVHSDTGVSASRFFWCIPPR